MSFMALGNPEPAMQNIIYYRFCSCPCHACTMGLFEGCENEEFVPNWNSQLLTFRARPPPLSLARHTANIRTWLETLKRQRNEFPSYFCLAWRPNIQQPTILLMTHMRCQPRDHNVRCHVLPLHDATPNDFGHCKCRLPNRLCPRTVEECNCHDHHAQLFPIADIMEVTVFREQGSYQNCFQRVRGQPRNDDHVLMDLPSNQRNELHFLKYAQKRLQFKNDFFTV